ncbi:hypothetical protein, partial [Massilia psychrophila]
RSNGMTGHDAGITGHVGPEYPLRHYAGWKKHGNLASHGQCVSRRTHISNVHLDAYLSLSSDAIRDMAFTHSHSDFDDFCL